MPLRACSLLPCCAPLKHSSAFGRHALHRRPSHGQRQSRRHRSTCIEAKKKGQQKASKRFGNQTFELKTSDSSDSSLTDYLKLGRAMGESPAEVEKALKAKGAVVEWDSTAQDYMQEWQDKEMEEYAGAAAIMSRLAQQAAAGPQPNLQSKLQSKLQKNKNKAGVYDVANEYAQQQLAALDVRKRFKPLTVLKATKGKAAPGVTLAQRPIRGASNTEANGEDHSGTAMLLSRPRPASEDEARWLQQAREGRFDNEDGYDDDASAFSSSADQGPPALLYEDFEALLNAPKARPSAKQQPKPPSKPALTPPPPPLLNRPQGPTPPGQRSQASSSSTTAAPSSASSVEEEDAPVLAARPGVYWQTKPSGGTAPPVAPPQKPPPMLLGRPAKPTPPSEEVAEQPPMVKEEEDGQLSAVAVPPHEHQPTLAERPAQPPPPASTPAQAGLHLQQQISKEEKQFENVQQPVATPPQEAPPTLAERPAQPLHPPPTPAQAELQLQQQTPKDEEHVEEVQRPAATTPSDPQLTAARPLAKLMGTPAQKEGDSSQQQPRAATAPQVAPPMLVRRPARPTPPPPPPPAPVTKEVIHQQQTSRHKEATKERDSASDITQENPPQIAQRAAHMPDASKQMSQSVVKIPKKSTQVSQPVAGTPEKSKPDSAKPDRPEVQLPELSRPQIWRQAEEQPPQPRVARPEPPLPALARPAPPSPVTAEEAAVDSKVAAAVVKMEERAKARRLRQVKQPAAKKAAAEKAGAEKVGAEKAGKPSLQLISPPRRREKETLSVADVTNPVSWGLMDFDKFAAKKPEVAELKRRDYFYRQPVAKGGEPQLPPPPLADRPARPPPAANDTAVQKSLTVTEWQQEAALQYAHRAMAAKREMIVFVIGANAGGVMVRSRNVRGFIPTKLLSRDSVTRVMTREAELREEKGMKEDASEEEVRNLRVEALRCMTRSILRGTIVNITPGRKLVLSERPPEDLSINPSQQQLAAEQLAVLRDNVGQVVQGLVVDVRPFGCFMEFDVEAESGSKHKVYGMVHVSEVSWDYCIDARDRVQVGDAVEAVLMGVDASTGKVWLSMRQVLPDPLQETLDALLAQGPPAEPSQGGGPSAGGSADDQGSPEDLSFPEDESSMAFREALEVAEALVLLPGVDSVTPGRQLFARAAAQDLQVYMSSVPLADFAASITAEERAQDSSSSSDEEDLGEDTAAVSAPATTIASILEAEGAVAGESQEHQAQHSSENACVAQQALGMTDVRSDGLTERVANGKQLTSEAADSTIVDLDGADVSGASTLVVRKGQQLQELIVSGSITEAELRDEIESIVSLLLSSEEFM